jgi:predicted XRE-type DNA-binding protein
VWRAYWEHANLWGWFRLAEVLALRSEGELVAKLVWRVKLVAEITHEKSSGNVFADIGFTSAEATDLTAKSTMIVAIKDAIQRQKLTQQEAARLYGTDQPTLSKVFRGRLESVTIDRLANWLNALGQDVEIVVKPAPRSRRQGRLRVVEAA